MGWAEKRFEEYKQGKGATWLERRMLEHVNFVNISLHIVGGVFLFFGLWVHDWVLIITGIFLSLFGHLYSWVKK